MRMVLKVAAVVAALTAAAVPARAQSLDVTSLGMAALGGWAGSNIGKGRGQLAATAAGTLLGYGLGSSMSDAGRRQHDHHRRPSYGHAHPPYGYQQQSYFPSAQYAPPPAVYYAPPPQVTYYPSQRANDGYCREFTSTAVVGGVPQQVYGTACEQPDGSWQIVDQR